MKAVRLLAFFCVVLMLASCSGLKACCELRGKWQKVDGTEMLEFTKGAMTLTDGPVSINTTYKVVDSGKQLQINVGSLGKVDLKLAVDQKTTLLLTDAQGKVSTFKKVQ